MGNTPTIFDDGYMDLRRLCVYTSLSRNTLRRFMEDGGLPYYTLAGKLLVKRSDFDTWMQQHRRQNTKIDDLVRSAVADVR
jgi:excisionase family DNA binding protein